MAEYHMIVSAFERDANFGSQATRAGMARRKSTVCIQRRGAINNYDIGSCASSEFPSLTISINVLNLGKDKARVVH